MSIDDPLIRLGKLRIIKASADLEVQITNMQGGGPAVEVLRRLRDRAAESIAALVIVDAEDPKAIRLMQNEVKRYDEWLQWLREIISEGLAYDKEITAAERNEMIDLLRGRPEGDRELVDLGLVDEVPHDA